MLNALLAVLLTGSIYAQNLLDGPECISYDAGHNRYLVSNYNNGNIIAIDEQGNHSFFKQGLAHAFGNIIHENILYVSDGTSIYGYDLDDPNITVMNLFVPLAIQMDGMAVDDNNNLYVVETIGARIFKIDLQAQTYSLFVTGLSQRPQDVVFDRSNNRLLVCSWYDNSPIQAVSLTDTSVTNLVSTGFGNCDGLAIDGNGNYYISSWTTNSVYYYNSSFANPPILLSGGHYGPSNIYYDETNGVVAIPCFNTDKLDLVTAVTTSIEDEVILPIEFELFQNYPNPFNPETIIKYSLPGESNIKISIYDITGREVHKSQNEIKSAGVHQYNWNAAGYASGIYFAKITAEDLKDNNSISRIIKMVLTK